MAAACAPHHDGSAQDRLSLARQYVALSQRAQRRELAHRKDLELVWGPFCQTRGCKIDLDQSILNAATKVEESHDDQIAQIMAAHLTSDDLLAAISFSKSREGQALRRASAAMADDAAKLDVEIAQQIHAQFVQEFCPKHIYMCARSGLQLAPQTGRQHSS